MLPTKSFLALALVAAAVVGGLAFAATLHWGPTRAVYGIIYMHALGLRDGYRLHLGQSVLASDGVRLATDVYLPARRTGPVPTILVRLPYDRRRYGGALQWARRYAPKGYAVVLQDMRGRYGSEGEFRIYGDEEADGVATLDWISRQAWSNGRVGTAGCSALGETQPILAKARHPAHRAVIAEAGGGAIGVGGETRGYFASFEGGIPELAGAVGWFLRYGGRTGDAMGAPDVEPADVVNELPSGTIVSRHRVDPTGYDEMLARFEDNAYWHEMGFLSTEDRFAAPALHVNVWFDPGISETFEVAELMRRQADAGAARENQPVIIGPGEHCAHHYAFDAGRIGDLEIDPAARFDYFTVYDRWFNHWLRDGPAPDLPRYTYYVLGADRWESSDVWPPKNARPLEWRLAEGGVLTRATPAAGSVSWTYDPMNPTPSLGGPDCCTGEPDAMFGPVDQRANAARADVVGFYSDPLDAPMTIVGDLSAEVTVSSDALDTDLVAVLLDVAPDGSMLGLQHGALRLRYRDGFDAPRLLTPGEPVTVSVKLRHIAYRIEAGHRIGLHISSSSFPRLERNLNAGSANYLETTPVIARNTVFFGGAAGSTLILPVMDERHVE
ncbi:MAG: CocE/NonD family hydrolase [Pseudomonadota bacterium]